MIVLHIKQHVHDHVQFKVHNHHHHHEPLIHDCVPSTVSKHTNTHRISDHNLSSRPPSASGCVTTSALVKGESECCEANNARSFSVNVTNQNGRNHPPSYEWNPGESVVVSASVCRPPCACIPYRARTININLQAIWNTCARTCSLNELYIRPLRRLHDQYRESLCVCVCVCFNSTIGNIINDAHTVQVIWRQRWWSSIQPPDQCLMMMVMMNRGENILRSDAYQRVEWRELGWTQGEGSVVKVNVWFHWIDIPHG